MTSHRIIKKLNGNWGFLLDPNRNGHKEGWGITGLQNPDSVTIPHTWNTKDGMEEYRGVGWYDYIFQVPQEWENRMVRIRFDAVYRDAVVWLNGQEVGTHSKSGYTSFTLDISDHIRSGGDNVLVVSVDNSPSDQALPIGTSFDWADDGGIIRDISFIVTGKTAIDFIKIDAIPHFTAEPEILASGTISLKIRLCELPQVVHSAASLDITVYKEGRMIWSGIREFEEISNSLIVDDIILEQVDLWHFDHPHLYELNVKVSVDGLIADEIESSFGFREMKAIGNQFVLNREPIRLMGVEWMPGSHPDIGMAESEEDMIRVLTQMKQANCLFTRFHWQQSEKVLEWCDRNGILVQEEIPHWQQPWFPTEELLTISKQHADEMVLRHYNHPCIFAWGMGNEVAGQSPLTRQYMKMLKDYMDTLDCHRMINYVSNSVWENPPVDATGVGDLIMWNEYVGTWHTGPDVDLNKFIESVQNAYPDKPIVIAEYGLCEPAFTGGDSRRIETLNEKTQTYRNYPSIAALIFFSFNDYRTQMGEDGEGRLRQRIHGITDLYGNTKPSYQAFRECASPIILQSVHRRGANGVECTIETRNDIPSYTISGYQLTIRSADVSGVETGTVIPTMAPGSTETLCVDGITERHNGLVVSILRPTGYRVLEKFIEIDCSTST